MSLDYRKTYYMSVRHKLAYKHVLLFDILNIVSFVCFTQNTMHLLLMVYAMVSATTSCIMPHVMNIEVLVRWECLVN